MSTFLLHGSWFAPIAMAAVIARMKRPNLARRAAILSVAALLVASCVVCFVPRGLPWELAAASQIDGISAILIPLTIAITLAVLIAAPRADLGAGAMMRMLLVLGATLGALVSTNVFVLLFFWSVSLVPLLAGVARDAPLRRALHRVFWGSTLPLGVALIGLVVAGWRAGIEAPWDVTNLPRVTVAVPWSRILGGLVLFSTLLRMGVFPLHSWIPATVQRAPLSLAIPTLVSPLGSSMLTRIGIAVFPDVFSAMTVVLVPLGVVSTVYGALLGLGQDDLRRQVGFFFVSTMSLVVVGLFALDMRTMSGGLLHEVGALLSVLGLLLLVWGIEARTGTVDMRRLGRLVRVAPAMTRTFFLIILAAVGFPATVGFVSEDLLMQGLIHDHPVMTALLLGATALNGIVLIRTFKRVFLGDSSPHAINISHFDDMLPRERWTLTVLMVVLLAGGLVPAPALAIRQGVVTSLERMP